MTSGQCSDRLNQFAIRSIVISVVVVVVDVTAGRGAVPVVLLLLVFNSTATVAALMHRY